MAFILGLFLFCILTSCEKTPDFQAVDSLPISSLELTDHRGSTSRIFEASELNGFRFRDEREYNLDSCNNFLTSLNIADTLNNVQPGYSLKLLIRFHNKLASSKLQANKFLFHEVEDFHVMLARDVVIFDPFDRCNLSDELSYLVFVLSEIKDDKGKLITLSKDLELKTFDRSPIRIGDLGYLKVNLTFDFIASELNTQTPQGTVLTYPMTLKLEHAIRYPELDK